MDPPTALPSLPPRALARTPGTAATLGPANSPPWPPRLPATASSKDSANVTGAACRTACPTRAATLSSTTTVVVVAKLRALMRLVEWSSPTLSVAAREREKGREGFVSPGSSSLPSLFEVQSTEGRALVTMTKRGDPMARGLTLADARGRGRPPGEGAMAAGVLPRPTVL